jgi:hypothetical protein
MYTSSTPSVATINSSGLITGVSQGSTSITVSQGSNITHIAKSAQATLTVVIANTLSFGTISKVILTTSSTFSIVRTLTTTTNSNATVVYSLVGTYTDVTLTDNQISVLNANSYNGTVTVRAVQAANATHASKTVTSTFTISKQT